MLRRFREAVKRSVLGPPLHGAYLRAFRREGEVLTIKAGPLAGKRWVRFMRTFNNEYVEGSYERPLQDMLATVLDPGMIFFDVGANAGFFSLLGSKLVGANGKVICFEPHPRTMADLRAQLRANAISNVTSIECAVSDRTGTSALSDDTFSVMASLDGAKEASRTVSVATTTIDEECRKLGIVPQVIKIDIEGHEMSALKGASGTIAKHKPILLVERHSTEIMSQYDALIASISYETSPIDGDRFVISRPSTHYAE